MAARGNRNNLSPDWTTEELAILSAYADPELPLRAVAARLPNRTLRAIKSKLYQAGITRTRGIRREITKLPAIAVPEIEIKPGSVRGWTALEIAKLCRLYSNHLVGFAEIYEKLKPKAPHQIRNKAKALGLPRQRQLSRTRPKERVEVSRKPGFYNFNFNLSPDELGEFAGHRR